MPTQFTVRCFILIPAAARATVNAALESRGFGPDSFSIRLVPRGGADDATETWYGADWSLTPQQKTVLVGRLDAAGIPYHLRERDHYDPQQGQPDLETVLVARVLKRRREASGV